MNPTAFRLHGKLPQIGIGLMLAAIWLYFLGGYHGLFHDARLYALLALNHLSPESFGRDLFVTAGSQGDFTVFPAIQARFISLLGLTTSTLLLTIAGLGMWFAALSCLVRRLVPGWGWALAILCLISGPRFYDAAKVFVYSETFLTPRLFAEAFSFLAIAQMLGGRHLRALGCLIGALLCHPLMTAYPLFVGFLIFLGDARVARRPRIALAAIAVIGVAVLTAARISVFARLFTPYDAEWFSLVQIRSPMMLPGNWDADFIGHLVFLYTVLLIGWRLSGSLIARHVVPIIAASLLMILAWMAGCTLWHDLFLTQTQLWRGIWLLQILSTIELVCLIWQRGQGNTADRWLAAMLATGWLQAGGLTGGVFINGWLASACAAAGMFFHYALPRLPAPLANHRFVRALPWLIPLPNLVSNLFLAQSLSFYSVTSPDALSWHAMRLAALGGILTVGILWLILARRTRGMTVSWIITTLGAAVFMTSLSNWGESAWRNFGKTPATPPAQIRALQARIPARALVLTDRDVTWTWFTLGRAAYVSNTQLAAVAFSRDIAMTGARRMRHLCASGFPDCGLGYKDADAPSLKGKHLDAAEIQKLCTDPDLDIVLLSGSYAESEAFRDNRDAPLSLIDCGRLRSMTGPAQEPAAARIPQS